MQVKNKKRSVVLTGVALGVLSMQAQAAVTFSNDYSYISMAGYADDYNILGAAGSSDYRSTIDVLGMPSQATDYRYASIIDDFGYETAFAESDAWADVDAYTVGNDGIIFGYVDAYASVYAETSNQDAYAYADSVIDLDFTIDGNYIYDFGADWMEAAGDASFYYDLYSWDTGTIIYSDELISMSATSFPVTSSPYRTGVLSAGSYNLVVKAVADADVLGVDYGYASGDFSLALTAVPVPAAVWLFGSGLLALAGIARRKTR